MCQSSSIACWWVLRLDLSIYQHDSLSNVFERFEPPCILHACESEVGVFLMQIWDLESKSIVDELKPQFDLKTNNAQRPYCISLQWSADGQTLFSGNSNYPSPHRIAYHLWFKCATKCATVSRMPCNFFKVLTQHAGFLLPNANRYCTLYLHGLCLACMNNYLRSLHKSTHALAKYKPCWYAAIL